MVALKIKVMRPQMLFAGAPKMLCAPPPRGGDRYATVGKATANCLLGYNPISDRILTVRRLQFRKDKIKKNIILTKHMHQHPHQKMKKQLTSMIYYKQ